jgi:hypothetical protein
MSGLQEIVPFGLNINPNGIYHFLEIDLINGIAIIGLSLNNDLIEGGT